MTLIDRLNYFSDNYDLIATGTYSSGPKQYIGGHTKSCRFCERGESETSFSNVAHAIPECLGNKQLILLDECDACNKHFSEIAEDHLDKFTKPFRTLAQIRGKKGVPSYKTNDKQSRIDVSDFVHIKSQIDSNFCRIDTEKSEVKLTLHQEPHIPLAVYKALVKIAISVIPDASEIPAFRETIYWLMSKSHDHSIISPAILMWAFIPGPSPTRGVAISLLRRKDSADVPYATLVMGFGNLVYQLIVPSIRDATNGAKITYQIPFFPSPFEFMEWPYGAPNVQVTDLSGTSKVSKEVPITMHFDSAEQIVGTEPPMGS